MLSEARMLATQLIVNKALDSYLEGRLNGSVQARTRQQQPEWPKFTDNCQHLPTGIAETRDQRKAMLYQGRRTAPFQFFPVIAPSSSHKRKTIFG
jgi:hypothetical protein